MMLQFSQAQGVPPRPGVTRAARARRRGLATVELALVGPLLALVILGMFELSRGTMAKETLSDAARKGCRTGIRQGKSNTDIYNDVVNIMRDNGYGTTQFNPQPPGGVSGTYVGSITITVTDPSNNVLTDASLAPSGSEISVKVAIPVSSVTWFSSYWLQGSMIQSDTYVMMKQG